MITRYLLLSHVGCSAQPALCCCVLYILVPSPSLHRIDDKQEAYSLAPRLSPQPSVELLQWAHATVRSRAEGEAVFARWFDAQGEVSETHTFESLWQEAGRIAHELRVSWGLAKGDRAVLCYGFGLDFFAAFLGCLRAGVLAVPVCEWLSVEECRALV